MKQTFAPIAAKARFVRTAVIRADEMLPDARMFGSVKPRGSNQPVGEGQLWAESDRQGFSARVKCYETAFGKEGSKPDLSCKRLEGPLLTQPQN